MGSPERLAALAAHECPECGRIYVVGGHGQAAHQCLHHEVTCGRCGATFKGPVKVDTRRRTPCECSVEDFDVTALRGVATRLEGARGRHLDLVFRLGEAGPGAVSVIAKEVTSWADATMSGLADEQTGEWEQLVDLYGVEAKNDLPRGVRTRTERRHKRQQREARSRALDRFLDDLGSYLRDLLVVHAGGDEATLVNLDRTAELRRDAARLSADAAMRGLADISRCREALDEFNGQPELQLERVLTPMAAAVFAAR
jgi:hypothetical protein